MYATLSLLLLLPITAFAAEVEFSYDLEANDGPSNWATLDIEDNDCGGMSQSGINVPTGDCDELNADYKLEVCLKRSFSFMNKIFFSRDEIYVVKVQWHVARGTINIVKTQRLLH
jgi:carbonic anhydrase